MRRLKYISPLGLLDLSRAPYRIYGLEFEMNYEVDYTFVSRYLCGDIFFSVFRTSFITFRQNSRKNTKIIVISAGIEFGSMEIVEGHPFLGEIMRFVYKDL